MCCDLRNFVHHITCDNLDRSHDSFEGKPGNISDRYMFTDRGVTNHGYMYIHACYRLIHAEWGALVIIPTDNTTENYTFAKTVRVTDGPHGDSSGVPYFYFTHMDVSVNDQQKNKRTSLTVSLAQSASCISRSLDPADNRCSHIIFTGLITALIKGSEEEVFAKSSLYSRHPEISTWSPEFAWYFGKLDIENIYLMDFFGTMSKVDIKEYFEASIELPCSS